MNAPYYLIQWVTVIIVSHLAESIGNIRIMMTIFTSFITIRNHELYVFNPLANTFQYQGKSNFKYFFGQVKMTWLLLFVLQKMRIFIETFLKKLDIPSWKHSFFGSFHFSLVKVWWAERSDKNLSMGSTGFMHNEFTFEINDET